MPDNVTTTDERVRAAAIAQGTFVRKRLENEAIFIGAPGYLESAVASWPPFRQAIEALENVRPNHGAAVYRPGCTCQACRCRAALDALTGGAP